MEKSLIDILDYIIGDQIEQIEELLE